MKVLNQAETALVLSDLLKGKAEIEYARADDHEGKERIYMTVVVDDSLKAFAHLFALADSSPDGHTRFCAIHTVGDCTCSLSPPERQP
jgi:hypothetical protein